MSHLNMTSEEKDLFINHITAGFTREEALQAVEDERTK